MSAAGANAFKSPNYDDVKDKSRDKLLELAEFTVRIGGSGGDGGTVSVDHVGSIVMRDEAGIGVLA